MLKLYLIFPEKGVYLRQFLGKIRLETVFKNLVRPRPQKMDTARAKICDL